MEQKPSVGRIVHYFGCKGDPPLPGIITAVHSDECVNLKVFDDGGNDQFFSSLTKKENEESTTCWDWPARV